jgi:hypothetical protein
MVTDVPAGPSPGLRLVVLGVGIPTVKPTPLLATPPTVTTTLPVVAPVGTVATMLVALQLVGVADVPLNLTVLVPCVAPKFAPVIVTDVPTGPELGLRLVMLGTATPVPDTETPRGTMSIPSATYTVPMRAPAAAGLNVTLTVHMPPTAMGEEVAQLSVSEKSPAAATGPTFKL